MLVHLHFGRVESPQTDALLTEPHLLRYIVLIYDLCYDDVHFKEIIKSFDDEKTTKKHNRQANYRKGTIKSSEIKETTLKNLTILKAG